MSHSKLAESNQDSNNSTASSKIQASWGTHETWVRQEAPKAPMPVRPTWTCFLPWWVRAAPRRWGSTRPNRRSSVVQGGGGQRPGGAAAAFHVWPICSKDDTCICTVSIGAFRACLNVCGLGSNRRENWTKISTYPNVLSLIFTYPNKPNWIRAMQVFFRMHGRGCHLSYNSSAMNKQPAKLDNIEATRANRN